MNTITKKIHIPESVREVTVYIAFDGREFYREAECRNHEKIILEQQEIKSHPVFQSERPIELYPECESAHLYYIGSDEEYDFLLACKKPGRATQDDYEKHGPGFYILQIEQGDYRDSYYLLHLNTYLNLVKLEYRNWLSDIDDCIDSIKAAGLVHKSFNTIDE